MSFFIFNGYNSDDDLIITSPVTRSSWAAEMNEITTAATAKVIQMSKTYSNSPLQIETVIKDTSNTDRMKELYSSLRGFGKLVLSRNMNEYMNAVVSLLQPQPVAMDMAELTVNFTLLPFAYAVDPTVSEIEESYTEIVNNGTVFSAPEIRIVPDTTGEVTINVNDAEFRIVIDERTLGKEIIIDCDAEITYYVENGANVSINNCTYGYYPLLHTGSNWVKYSGSLSAASINVRERWY